MRQIIRDKVEREIATIMLPTYFTEELKMCHPTWRIVFSQKIGLFGFAIKLTNLQTLALKHNCSLRFPHLNLVCTTHLCPLHQKSKMQDRNCSLCRTFGILVSQDGVFITILSCRAVQVDKGPSCTIDI